MKNCLFIALILTILFASCERDFSGITGFTSSPPITSHEYEWEMDTLYAPTALQVIMSDIWGTDENNVYVVGHSDENKYQVWHWDGEKWENIDLFFPGYPYSLNAIYGFAGDDIWVVGTELHTYAPGMYKDFIAHYNGSQWELMKNIDAPWCFSVWGTSSNNLFVGSDSGIILHYNGSEWEKQYTGTMAGILSIFGFNENDLFAVGASHDKKPPIDTTYYYFFKYNSLKWKLINFYKRTIALEPRKFGHRTLWGVQNVLYSGGYGLYQYNNNEWFPIFDDNIFIWDIYGNHQNDIFAVGLFGYIFHYNGVDWYLYKQFLNKFINNKGVWMYGDYVFIIGQPPYSQNWQGYSVILRGKRKRGGDVP